MIQRDNPLISAKYKSKKWQKTRQLYLISVNGLCERCMRKGIYNPAIIVHHIIYIDESNYMQDEIFFNSDNLEALCKDCHNKEHFRSKEEFLFDEDGNLIKNK